MDKDGNGHTSKEQPSEIPFQLAFDTETIVPGEQIEITLSGKTSEEKFKGFAIRAVEVRVDAEGKQEQNGTNIDGWQKPAE